MTIADTSRAAFTELDASWAESVVLQIHIEAGAKGIAQDELRDIFQARTPEHTQFTNRRTSLHDRGLVLRTGDKVVGTSGRQQHLYVARQYVTEPGLVYLKTNFPWLNPCLFGEGETCPPDPNSKAGLKEIIRELTNEACVMAIGLVAEGGVLRDYVGKPLDTPDSIIGRACAVLGVPVPITPDYGEQFQPI